MDVGSIVRFKPSKETEHICRETFMPIYGPQIGAVYRIEAQRNEGFFFEHGFGPYFECDLEELNDDTPLTPLLPIPPLRQLLKERGIEIPRFKVGDYASYDAEWATEEGARRLGIPVRGKTYKVVDVKEDGLVVALEDVNQVMSAWHLKKETEAEQDAPGDPDKPGS